MNSKNRLTISLVTLCVVLLFGIVAIGTWFVYLRYSVFTNINGQYRANRVMGEVVANAIFAGEVYNMTVDGDPNGAKKLSYNGSEVGTTNILCVPGDKVFSLSDKYDYIVLEFKFTNTSPDEEWLINLNSEFATCNNVVVTSAYFENEGITNYSLIDTPYDNEYIKSLPVSTNGSMFVYIKIRIDDKRHNSDFELNMSWTLNARSFVEQY